MTRRPIPVNRKRFQIIGLPMNNNPIPPRLSAKKKIKFPSPQEPPESFIVPNILPQEPPESPSEPPESPKLNRSPPEPPKSRRNKFNNTYKNMFERRKKLLPFHLEKV